MTLRSLRPVGALILLGWLLVVVSACETSFEPFVESDLTYTILGYLDTDADTQYVRVSPLRQVVDRGGPMPIDARVATVDLETGLEVVWRDSIVQFEDQSYGHVFWAAFRAIPEHRYRITIERSDAAQTWAETLVPALPADPESVYGADNESSSFAPLFWPGVSRVIDADVTYRVSRLSCDDPVFPPPQNATVHFVRMTDQDMGSLTPEGAWRIDLNLKEDQEVIHEILGIPPGALCDLVALYALEVRLASPSLDWEPPGGVWDPDVLIQPGTFSNVEGGFGWFGSVARSTVAWDLSLIALRELSYEPYFEQ